MQRILIVDEDLATLEILRDVLVFEGYAADCAASEPEALALAEVQAFDLVLLESVGGSARDPFGPAARIALAVAPTPAGLHTAWRLPPATDDRFAFSVAKPADLVDLLEQISTALGRQLPRGQSPEAEVVHRYFELLGSRDWDQLAALCAHNVVYVLPGETPFSAEIRGRKTFRDFAERTFEGFPRAQFDHVAVHRTPEGLAARYEGSWDASGHRKRQAGSVVFRFEGALLSLIRVSMNIDRLQRALS